MAMKWNELFPPVSSTCDPEGFKIGRERSPSILCGCCDSLNSVPDCSSFTELDDFCSHYEYIHLDQFLEVGSRKLISSFISYQGSASTKLGGF